MYVYIRDAQSSLVRTRCVVAPLAPRSDSLACPALSRARLTRWKPLPVVTGWGCTLAMFVPLRKLRSSFEEKWNKFKYIFSAFRIKQKDASQRAAARPANCRSFPFSLSQGRCCSCWAARLQSLGPASLFSRRLPSWLCDAASAAATAIYCCSFASYAAIAIVSVYLFTFALYYSPLT